MKQTKQHKFLNLSSFSLLAFVIFILSQAGFSQGCYEVPLTSLNSSNSLIVNGVNSQDDLGHALKDAGDINGDGIADIIIGAPGVDDSSTDEGAAYVIFGATGLDIESFDLATLDGTNGFAIVGTNQNDKLGWAVDGAGDFNADGIDDVIIGMSNRVGISRVLIVFGSSTGFSSSYQESDLDGTNGIIISSDVANNRFSEALSRAGDVNNDGIADIIINAPGDDTIFTDSGRSYVIFGSASIATMDVSALDGTNGFYIHGFSQSIGSRTKVSDAGDINNDGVDDLVLGFPSFDEGGLNDVGRVSVVFGTSSGFSSIVDLNTLNGVNGFSLLGEEERAELGASVSTAEDFNNDGITDFIIGSPGKDYFTTRTISDLGEAYVIYGKNTFPALLKVSELNSTNSVTIRGDEGFELFNRSNNRLGSVVDGLKDINGDGITDIIIAAPNGAAANKGGVYIIYGADTHPTLISADDVFGTIGYQIFEAERIVTKRFGQAVSSLGDFNNDGVNDFAVGAVRNLSFRGDNGRAYIFYGGIFDLPDTELPSISCPTNQQLYANASLPNYITFIGNTNDNCTYQGELTFTQSPPQGTIIASDTNVMLTVSDRSGNINSCSFLVSIKTTTATIDCNTTSFNVSNLNGDNGLILYGEFAMGRTGGGEKLDVDAAGDVNGDGIQDFIVGSTGIVTSFDGPYRNQRVARDGSAYIVFGTSSGFPPNVNLALLDGTNGFIVRNDTEFSNFPTTGASVSSAGDINGDGVDDIMIGDPYRTTSLGPELGYTHIIFGRRSGFQREFFISSLDGTNGFTIIGVDRFGNAGIKIDNLGDINNDGIYDIAILGSKSSGSCYVVYGIDSSKRFPPVLKVDELDGTNGFTINGFFTDNGSGGSSLAGVGDINGDGINDIAISGNSGPKRHIIYGSANIPSLVEVSTLNGTNGFAIENSGQNLSAHVSKAGDINGDGYGDVLIGLKFIVFGGNALPAVVDVSNLDGTNGYTLDDIVRGAEFAGDFNNDGIDDIIVDRRGSIYILYGKSNWDETVTFRPLSTPGVNIRLDLGEGFDTVAKHAGDVNNDGIDDVIIGKYSVSNNYDVDAPAPTIFVVFGQDTPDVDPPEITACLSDQILALGEALPDYTPSVVATDDCDTNLEIEQSPAAGTIFTANTTVTVTVTDKFGKESLCTFEVKDSKGPFITSWDTRNNPNNPSDNTVIIPIDPSFTSNYTVDWGDGQTSTGINGSVAHTYATPGIYDISITGDFPGIYINNFAEIKDKLLEVKQWGGIEWKTFFHAFHGATNFKITATDVPDLSQVTNMSHAFARATNFNDPLNNWVVDNVTDMSSMFAEASAFNQPLDSWNVANVTTIEQIFLRASSFDQNLNSWNFTNLSNVRAAFAEAISFNQPLDNWNLSGVTSLELFLNSASSYDQSLAGLDISTITNMNSMLSFSGLSLANYDATLIGWSQQNVQSNVTLSANTLEFCDAVKQRDFLTDSKSWTINDDTIGCDFSGAFITRWDTRNHPTITDDNTIIIPVNRNFNSDYLVSWGDGNFSYATNLSLQHTYDTPGIYEVQIIGDFPGIFINNDRNNKDKLLEVVQWGDIEWKSFKNAFWGASNLNFGLIPPPDLSRVTDMSLAFDAATNFNGPLDAWDISNVTNLSRLFNKATNFNQPLNTWDVRNVVSASSIFSEASNFNQPLSNWKLESATTINFIFNEAINFNQPLDAWNVSNITGMESVFRGATAFNQPIDSWDVSKVTSMQFMFNGASNFDQPLNSWDVSNVTSFQSMFNDAGAFNQPLDNWDVSGITDMSRMFRDASSFNQSLASWDVSNVTTMNSMFFNATAFNRPLNTWDVSSVNNMVFMLANATSFNQPLDSWNIGSVTNMAGMLSRTALSKVNYDATLIGWAAQSVQSNVELGANGLSFCDAEQQRQSLIDNNGWTITGDTLDCDITCTTITAPLDGVTDVARDVEITWDVVANATDYLLSIGTTSGGVDILDNAPQGDVTSYTPTTAFAEGTTLFVTVIPTNGTGAATGCSEVSFTTLAAPVQAPFITRWDTRNTIPVDNNNAELTIPANPAFTYNYIIDWGDGQIDTGVTGNATHTYTTPGEYEVSITGDFPAIHINNDNDYRSKLLEVIQWGDIEWQSFESAFMGASNLNFGLIPPPDLSQVTNMTSVFALATSFNGLLNNWDVRNVNSMVSMFSGATSFNQPLDTWDVSNVTNMRGMFTGATVFNQPINTWNVSSVIDMQFMFTGARSFNQPIITWDVSSVIDMQFMFSGAKSFNQPISTWDVSSVINMEFMFSSARAFNQPLNDWDISSVTSMRLMLNNSGLSKVNYDATLIGWAAQTVQANVALGADGLTFCDAEQQRQSLIDNNGWTIIGDTLGCDIPCTTITAPLDGATNVLRNTSITWNAATNATDYLLSIGTTSGGTDILNNAAQGNVTSYTPATAFAEGTTFYVTVTPTNATGAAVGCSEMNFTTETTITTNQNAFITRWDTRNTIPVDNNNADLTIPTNPAFTYNYTIDWGDGTIDTGVTGNATHTYTTPGVYEVSITGDFPAIQMNTIFNNSNPSSNKLLEVLQWGTIQWQSFERAFKGASNLNFGLIPPPDLSQVTNFDYAFSAATSFNAPLNDWDVSSATTMEATFGFSPNFNQPLDKWDMSNVTNIRFMFAGASAFNQPLGSWVTSSVNRMDSIFTLATIFNQSINTWDVSNVSNMNAVFSGATAFNQPLDRWDVSRVTNTSSMFKDASAFNQPLNTWDVSKVFTLSSMFDGASSFNQTLASWNVSNAQNMSLTFKNAIAFDQPLNTWNVSNVTTISSMFDGATSFNQPLNTWDVSNVTNMSSVFRFASSFNQPIENWNISNVTTIRTMFSNASSFNQPLEGWDTSKVTTLGLMFSNASAFNQPLNNWDTSNVTETLSMFRNATSFNQPLDNWDISSVTDMSRMLNNSGLSKENYDATLIGWANQNVQPNIELGAENLTFCEAEQQRQSLIDNNGWVITGDTLDCDVTCTSITAPLDGAVDVATNTTITWDAVSNATDYVLSIGTTSGGVDILDNAPQGDVTSYTPTTAFAENTTLYVTVVPTNAAGTAVGCSEMNFTTEVELQAPVCTNITFPIDGSADVARDVEIRWDAVSEATDYMLSIGTTSGGVDILNNAPQGDVTSYMPSPAFAESTTLYVTVVPTNAAGAAVGCTEISFTTEVELQAPVCTNITFPIDGSVDVARDVEITWDAVAEATDYLLSIGTTSGGVDILNNAPQGDVTSYTPSPDFAESTTLYVTVVPTNAAGAAVGCTEISFTIEVELQAPVCTNITFPIDGSVDVARDVEIRWDAVAEATDYLLSIGTTSGGVDILNNAPQGDVTSYTPSPDFAESTTLYVTVVPTNAAGAAVGCTEISFTIEVELQAPVCTNITFPIDGSVDVARDVEIRWDAVSEATDYILSIGTTSGGTDILDNASQGNVTSYTPNTAFAENTTLYVTVVPTNVAGAAVDCSEMNFTTEAELQAPVCTNITFPINGSVDVASDVEITWDAVSEATDYVLSIGTTSGADDVVSASVLAINTTFSNNSPYPKGTLLFAKVVPINANGTAIGCNEISFTTESELDIPVCTNITNLTDGDVDVDRDIEIVWDAVADATNYNISVGTSSGADDVVGTSSLGNQTSFTNASIYSANTTLYVTVTPTNAAGAAVGCSEISFTTEVELQAPICTNITFPINGSVDVARDIEITWDAVSEATDYVLNIGTTSRGTDILDNVSQGNVTSYTPNTAFAENTTLYVTVVPTNVAGAAVSCSEMNFTTEAELQAPVCTNITFPINGSVDVARDVEITWDAVSEATDYMLSIGTTSGGVDILNNASQGNVTSFTPSTAFAENTTLYVTVTSTNAAGAAVGCTEISFTTEAELQAPVCTNITFPINGSVDVARDVEITWDAVAGATGYLINLGTSPTDNDFLNEEEVISDTSLSLDFLGLDYDTTYYLQVTPFNNAGIPLVSCDVIAFDTEVAPNTIKLGFSPNGDGVNEFWTIADINLYPNNEVFIYNRWGDMVFYTKSYDNFSRVFRGEANRSTEKGAATLPDGTYFFDIKINGNHNLSQTRGFLVLKR